MTGIPTSRSKMMTVGFIAGSVFLAGGIDVGQAQEAVVQPAPADGAETGDRQAAPADPATAPVEASAETSGVAPDASAAGSGSNAAAPAEIQVDVPPAADAGSAVATPAPSLGIQEIVVTAQKREESANDIPIAITAFTGDNLEQLGVADTRDLGKVVPGFTFSDSGFSTPVYTLRGVGFNDFSYSATSTVGVYADEVSLPYSVMTKGANFDLQRVEVLKGPQGTLYGRNSTGGTINYIANKPTHSLQFGTEASYSRFNTLEVDGFVSGPLTDTLSGRLAAQTTQSNKGWQISQTRPDDHLGKRDKGAARGTLQWDPRDDLSFRLVASGWWDHSEPQAPYAVALRPQNQITGDITFDNFFHTAGGLAHVPTPVLDALIAAFDTAGIGNQHIQGTVHPAIANYPYDPGNDNPRTADWDPDTNFKLHELFWSVANRSEWKINDDMALTALLSYDKVRTKPSPLPQGGTDSLQSEVVVDSGIKSYSAELRLSGTAHDDITWLIGASAAFDKTLANSIDLITTNSFNFPIPGVGGIPGQPPVLADKIALFGKTDAESYGIFTNGDWQFTDTLKIALGLRYTTETRKSQQCTYYPPDAMGIIGFNTLFNLVSLDQGGTGGAVQGNPPEGCMTLDDSGNPGLYHGKLDEHNVSMRTSLNWTPIDDNMFYASYSRGFKSGGFPILLAARQSNYEPATQEKLIAYEIGNKSVLWDHKLQINGALFYYDYADKQLLTYINDQVFGPLPLLRNAPKSDDKGVELTTTLVPVEGLYLTAIASYIKTKIKEFESTTAQGVDYNFAGRPFNFAPKFQTAIIANYTFPLNASLELSTGADYNYNSKTNATLEGDPAYAIPDYFTIGAHVGIAQIDHRWTITAFGHNLTNEQYRSGVFRSGDTVAAFSGAPRIYGVTLGYNFE